MTVHNCYNCGKVFDEETDDYERCVNCDKEYCEECAEMCAIEWYEDNDIIPWITSCKWCGSDYRF